MSSHRSIHANTEYTLILTMHLVSSLAVWVDVILTQLSVNTNDNHKRQFFTHTSRGTLRLALDEQHLHGRGIVNIYQ